MTATDAPVPVVLRRAARRGVLAWSVAHTQPWRFELSPTHLDLIADPTRRLEALDASGRMQAVSLGAALYDLRVALAAAGLRPDIERLPDPARPDLVARIALAEETDAIEPIGEQEPLLDVQPGEAVTFTSGELPAPAVAAFRDAVEQEGVELLVVTPGRARTVFELCREARDIQLVDSTCRAELRAWTGAAEREPEFADPATAPRVLVLGGGRDDRLHWLRSGEALQRMLLSVAAHDLVASTVSCVLEVPSTRLAVREALDVPWFPHVVVRVGQGVAREASLRRRLVEVLFETD